MLDQIKIASPCSADWEQMKGNDRVRFCGECKKNVFNLSAMTRRDAEALLKETNGNICARSYRRTDGTVLTEDCPVGLRVKVARVQRRVGWAVAGALSFATVWGQGSSALSGRVTDQMGAAVSATITVTDSKTGDSQQTKADADGKFRVGSLPPGIYTITAESPGFYKHTQSDVRVDAIGPAKLDVTLRVGLMTGWVVLIERKPWWRRIL